MASCGSPSRSYRSGARSGAANEEAGASGSGDEAGDGGGDGAPGGASGASDAAGDGGGGQGNGGSDAVGGSAGGGEPLTCSDGLSACSGACVDTQKDPQNCGRCAHDCLGGECELGKCQPVVVAPEQPNLVDVATDGTYVYWSGSDSALKNFYVARRRADRSDAVKTIATGETRAEGLAISSGRVFWLGDGHVRVCGAPDCNGGPTNFEATVQDCFHLLATPTSLFWSCQAGYGKNDGSVWSAASAGSTPVNLEPSSKNPRGFASDGDAIYWVNAAGFNAQGALDPDGAVWRMSLSTRATTKLVSSVPNELSHVAVGGGRLYFDEPSPGAIYSVPLPNGAVSATKLADFKGGGIVADEKAVYWTDYVNGAVLTCPHIGCTDPEVIAPGQSSPYALAQDAVSVYWISASPGLAPVQRLAK